VSLEILIKKYNPSKCTALKYQFYIAAILPATANYPSSSLIYEI